MGQEKSTNNPTDPSGAAAGNMNDALLAETADSSSERPPVAAPVSALREAAGEPGSGNQKAIPTAGTPGGEKTTSKAKTSNAEKKRRRDAAKPTNDFILKMAKDFGPLFAEADIKDVETRCEIGKEFCERLKAGGYGDAVVPEIAKKLGRNKDTIYGYVNVARTWPDREKFGKVAKMTGKFGKALTWSHFVELAREKNVRRRMSLLIRALTKGWKVKDLITANCGSKPSTAKTPGASASTQPKKTATPKSTKAKDPDGASGNPAEPSDTTPCPIEGILTHLTDSTTDLHNAVQQAEPGQLAAVPEKLPEFFEALSNLCQMFFDKAVEQAEPGQLADLPKLPESLEAANKVCQTFDAGIDRVNLRLKQLQSEERQPDDSQADEPEKEAVGKKQGNPKEEQAAAT